MSRRSPSRSLVALLPALALLAGCGGHSSSRVPPPPKSLPGQAHGHACSPANYFMQCAARAPQAPALRLGAPRPGVGAAFGIDFAWGGPSGPAARAGGAHFGVSYVSYDPSKDWKPALARSYLSAGLGVVLVWESGASRSLSGCSAGSSDARAASARAASLGLSGAPVYLASDFDTSGFSLHGTVGSYYACARAVLGSRTGAYGGLRTMQIAEASGISRLWQTIAWSGGAWDPRACLHQTSINSNWYGYSVDFDYAVCPDYGQYGFRPAPPPAPRLKCFGPHARLRSSTCKRVRSEVAGWSRARDATDVAIRGVDAGLRAHRCRRPYRRDVCIDLGREIRPALVARLAYFRGRIHSTLSRY